MAKLQRAQVRGLLRDLAGQLTVHASAAAIDGRAVVFLGSDGAGKSTAAAELCLQHGAKLLADDAALLEVGLEGVRVMPSEEDHWLTPESRNALGVAHPSDAIDDKHDLRASVAHASCPVGAVVALRFDPSFTEAVVRRPRGSEAARWMLEAVIRFDVDDGPARGRELEQLMKLYASAPFLEVARPARAPRGIASIVMNVLRARDQQP